jgi:hypothetical protein
VFATPSQGSSSGSSSHPTVAISVVAIIAVSLIHRLPHIFFPPFHGSLLGVPNVRLALATKRASPPQILGLQRRFAGLVGRPPSKHEQCQDVSGQ